jgi:hypothetical protein
MDSFLLDELGVPLLAEDGTYILLQPTTYDGTVSEGLTLSDVVTSVYILNLAVSEGLAIGDSPAAAHIFSRLVKMLLHIRSKSSMDITIGSKIKLDTDITGGG